METSVDGVRFVRWLNSPPPVELIARLVGCIFDDGINDFDQVVTRYDTEEKTFTCTAEGKTRKIGLVDISKGYILVPDERQELIQAISDAQPQHVRDGEETLEFLRGKKVNVTQINDVEDAHVIREAIERADSGEIPNYNDQTSYYETFKKCQMFWEGAKAFSKWLKLAEGQTGPYNAQLRIKVA